MKQHNNYIYFRMMRQEDEQELARYNKNIVVFVRKIKKKYFRDFSITDSGSSSPIDFESPADMAEVLSARLANTLAQPHFVSLLQHLLMIPSDERHLHLWRLFDT